MGNCLSSIRKKKPEKAITIGVIGLDNAGKTTLCSVLVGEQPDPNVVPTVGFRNVKFSHTNFAVTAFDLGGGKNIRPIWKTYFGEVYGIVYVIDSSSSERLSEARDTFRETLEHPQVSGKPVLVLANKVDKEEHMKEVDIVNGLHLEDTVNANNCPSKLVMASALQGVGSKMDKQIQVGIKWLFDKIQSSLTSLEPRVEADMRAAKEARDKEREERRARVKKQREEREKAEELERTRLGITKKDEDDDEDIVDGNPFKALDMETLKMKEQQLKDEKKEKQRRMKELGYGDGMRRSLDDTSISYGGDDSLRSPHSRQLQEMKAFDLSGDPSFRKGGIESSTSAMSLFGRNTRASTLPPLEPQGSLSAENAPGYADKRKMKKKKKLTDYHLESRNGSGFGYTHKDTNDTVDKLGLSLHEPDSWRREADVHDLTPRVAKPKKNRMVVASKIDEDEEENDFYNDIGGRRFNGYRDDDILGRSQKQSRSKDPYSSVYGSRDSSHMNGYDSHPRQVERENSAYRQSLRKISPPNVGKFDDEDEGIEQDDTDNSDVAAERYRAARHANNLSSNKLRDPSRPDSRKKPVNSQLSDEDEDAYAVHNALKDTLRFQPDSDDEQVDRRDYRKEIDELRRRSSKNDHSSYHNKGYDDDDSDYAGYKNKKTKKYGDMEDNYSKSKHGLSRGIHSPDEDEGFGRKDEVSDHRRKKKRNLLRSNKLAPSDDEELDTSYKDRFHSPRLVQEHGSRNTSDADTPTRHKNTKVTQYHRNVSHDSDFNSKWGLAEDLPAVDNNYNVRRLPNFDDSDNGDISF